MHDHLAVQLGALVEHLAGEQAYVFRDRFVEQANDRAGEVTGLRCDLSGEAQGAVERDANR